MKVLSAFIAIATVVGVFPVAEAGEIEEIGEYYDHVMENLDSEYGLHRTEISINDNDTVYPAIGHYQETITFYWSAEGGEEWLVLVIWTGEYAYRREYGEILYDPLPFRDCGAETAVYQYASSLDWDGNTTEYRWWYSDGGLLQSSAATTFPDEVVEFSPEGPEAYTYVYTPQTLLEMFNMVHSRDYS